MADTVKPTGVVNDNNNSIDKPAVPTAAPNSSAATSSEAVVPEVKPAKDVTPAALKPTATEAAAAIGPTAAATTTTATATPANGSTPEKQKNKTATDITFDDDPTAYIKAQVNSLIYWEKPVRSGAILATLLGILVLTQYYSVLQLAAGFFTIVTGLNWLYVNAHKQGQRVFGGKSADELMHPHSQRLAHTSQGQGILLFPRERAARTAHLMVDVLQVGMQQLTRLVLIEDSWRSATALAVSYAVWVIGKYISTKYLLGLFLVGAFSLPRIYAQYQEVIDRHVAEYSEKARALAKQYGGVAGAKAKELYGRAVDVINSKSGGKLKMKKAE